MKKTTTNTGEYELCAGFRIRTIYPAAGRRYQVDLGTKSGKHVRKRFKIREEARSFAKQQRAEVERKGVAALHFTDHQKTDAVEALQLLKGYGINLRAVASFYIKHNQKVDETNGTAALIGRYLADRKVRLDREEIRPRTYEEDLKHLKDFQSDHAHLAIDTIEAVNIDQWLDKKYFKPTSRENHRRYLSIFFNWAIEHDRIQTNPVKKTRKIKKVTHTPEIYKADETAEIMKQAETHHKALVPYLSIAFFAGVRPNEILRLNWKDIDFEHEEIHVKAEQSKTSNARRVHMPKNLISWLTKYKQDSGAIFTYSDSSLKKWRQEVYRKAKVTSIQDGGRHSFATYYLALHGIDSTIQELGHTDSKMLFKHYKGLSKNRKSQADKYFSVEPQREKKDKKGNGDKGLMEALDSVDWK